MFQKCVFRPKTVFFQVFLNGVRASGNTRGRLGQNRGRLFGLFGLFRTFGQISGKLGFFGKRVTFKKCGGLQLKFGAWSLFFFFRKHHHDKKFLSSLMCNDPLRRSITAFWIRQGWRVPENPPNPNHREKFRHHQNIFRCCPRKNYFFHSR